MAAIDLVFDPEGTEVSGGLHNTRQLDTAPQAWDHIDQQEPQRVTQANHPGRNAFTVSPNQALPVVQRSVNHHSFSAIPIAGTLASTQGPAELVSSQKGRAFIIIKCPPSNTKGVFISDQKDSLVAAVPLAWLVSPSDAPLTIQTEDALWFMGQAGAAQTDVVQICVGWYKTDEF